MSNASPGKPFIRHLIAVALTLVAAPAAAGPLLDDYLNYARLGERCTGGKAGVTLTADAPLGQIFAVAPGTGEIFRLGVQPEAASWEEAESVTLTLYDAPSKGKTYGAFTVDGRTCRVQPNRGEKMGTELDERVLLFPLRAKLSGERTLYFELTVADGDGKVAFRSVPYGGYAGGEGFQGGKAQAWDLCFETHVKPAADRAANLKALWDRFDLAQPSLAAVRTAVGAGDFDRAEAAAVKHFHSRADLFAEWKDMADPTADTNFDRAKADRLLQGNLWTKDGAPLPWRHPSYWAPEYPQCGKDGRDFEPNIYSWHIQRHLAAAYSATKEEKYARAAIDLWMQWVLDNCPGPRVTGIRCPHPIWNELIAAGRAPGHGKLVYARLYNYPGWTTDEKLVFFLSWLDNAEYLYKSDVGGNWGFQTGKACYDFGRTFPEFKQSRDFASWGAARVCALTLECVRGDGTEHEAAIKYHAMCARRLKGLLEDHEKGAVELDPKLLPDLRRNLEGMYEHMMYTQQPDRYVVMCGDSWHENYSDELVEVGRLLKRPDFVWAGTGGREGAPPAETSKAFTEGGYYIMRSDFGGEGRPFEDARQMFIHNGGWSGSHGHWDLLSVNVYAFGRPLIVDPGQYDYEPPAGLDRYWVSRIHSMLVPNGWDCAREPGPSRWVSAPGFDAFDGVHHGYKKRGIDSVRRRIVFLKPDTWVVNDSAEGRDAVDWEQVWNFAGKDVKVDAATRVVESSHPDGGNLIAIPARPEGLEVAQRAGGTKVGEKGYGDTRIVSYRLRTAKPRITTVLIPYKGCRPDVAVATLKPDGEVPDPAVAVSVTRDGAADWVAWGDAKRPASFGGGAFAVDGALLAVRSSDGRSVTGFSWTGARRATFDGRELARAEKPVAMLDVAFAGGGVRIDAREEEPTLDVWVGSAATVIVNGRKLEGVQGRDGFVRPFAGLKNAIVVDDDSQGFRRVTQSEEWETVSVPEAYGLSYTTHETDPGRHESAAWAADIPEAGRYRIEAFIPKTTRPKTDAMRYVVQALSGRPCAPATPGGVVRGVTSDAAKGQVSVTVDQQPVAGAWVDLGAHPLARGRIEFLTAVNDTATDGLYPAFDAVRLTPE